MLTHHAQLIEGNESVYQALLHHMHKSLGIDASHPDIATFSFIDEKLGVDEAHKIRDALLRNPTSSPQTIVVVYAHTLTEQAQNALLKISEEPPANSFLFLVTNFVPHLIPTLRSRFIVFELPGIENKKIDKENFHENELLSAVGVQTFLEASVTERLEIVKKIHAGMDKETVAVSEVWDFINKIEKELHTNLIEEMNAKNTSAKGLEKQEQIRDVLEVLARTQNYMHAPGNSVKMLMEYLAVRL